MSRAEEADRRRQEQEEFERQRQLLARRRELEQNIASCPNDALRQHFQAQLEQVCYEIRSKDGGGGRTFQHSTY